MPRFTALLFIALLALLSAGCAEYRFVDIMDRSRPWLIVPHMFTADSRTLPPGIYRPVLEDDAGTYFQSPRGTLVAAFLAPRIVVDGGVYVRKADGAKYSYVMEYGGPNRSELPDTFHARLVVPPKR